jgi:hypothetical protein|tara:strand:- start:609 stop:881 length:273 start_codon:yes stop_codon:yes gene_type:complete
MTNSGSLGVFDVGIFGEATRNIDVFGSNIYLTQMLSASLMHHRRIQREYDDALASEDALLAATKETELKMMEGQFRMASAMFDLWGENYS